MISFSAWACMGIDRTFTGYRIVSLSVCGRIYDFVFSMGIDRFYIIYKYTVLHVHQSVA
jgi:hypothetical protein